MRKTEGTLPSATQRASEDRKARLRRLLATFLLLDTALIALYLVLRFTVFAEPTYVPFASGNVSTLVPEGPYGSSREGAWLQNHFNGKGELVIGIRSVAGFDLSDLVRHARNEAAAGDTGAGDTARADAALTGDAALRDLVRRARGQYPGRPDSLSAEVELRELVSAARADTGGLETHLPLRVEPGRTIIQIMATNTPNLRLTEEVPAFDSTIFCLGSVGRGQRWYRYLVHSGGTIVDLSMHSAHSSHIVYKEALDKALLNLRIDGVASNHILEQAVMDINGRISPRWVQGNVFWLVFFLILPSGIMSILLAVFFVSASRAKPQGPTSASAHRS